MINNFLKNNFKESVDMSREDKIYSSERRKKSVEKDNSCSRIEKKELYDLRIAIISDLHIGFEGHSNPEYYGLGQEAIGSQEKWWEYVLRYYKHRGVDAIVVPGDITNAWSYKDNKFSATHAINEFKKAGDIFRKVFKNQNVKMISIYGNHDNTCQHLEKLNGGYEDIWENAFHEPYSHTFLNIVKGYTFIGANWGYEKECKSIIDEHVKNNPNKPIFYMQHGPIVGTTCDSLDSNINDIGLNNIKRYDNVIALFGHTHMPITDEGVIWQSKVADERCTVISCGTLNYAGGIRVSGDNLMTKQGLYLTLKNKEVNIERLSFFTPEMLALVKGEKNKMNYKECVHSCGADWHFTLGDKKVYDFYARKNNESAPEFSPTAKMGIVAGDTYVQVCFPVALSIKSKTNILQGYDVEIWDNEEETIIDKKTVYSEYHIDHSSSFLSRYYQTFLNGLKKNVEYTIKVYAKDCFENRSKNPLVGKIKL